MKKIADFFNNTFGKVGKWILLSFMCLAIILGIVLFAFFIKYFKIAMIVIGVLGALAFAGFMVYQFVIKKRK